MAVRPHVAQRFDSHKLNLYAMSKTKKADVVEHP
jgi:hypothetical protein